MTRWSGVEVAIAATTLAVAMGAALVRDLRDDHAIPAGRTDWGWVRVEPPAGAETGPPWEWILSSPCNELDERDLDFGPKQTPFADRVPYQLRRKADVPCVVAGPLVETPGAFVHAPERAFAPRPVRY